MAGHSKWANIQHRKSAQDARRGKLFTKLIREITVAARLGGADPGANSRLRLAVDKALANNMSKETVERAIKRGAGATEEGHYEEVRYEGYGPGGVAVMVECMTDNRNRTVAEVRHAFAKCGGHLGTEGSVAYLFTQLGLLSYPAGSHEDRIMEVALEVGAQDLVSNEDGSIDVLTHPEDFVRVKKALVSAGLAPEHTEVTLRASANTVLGFEDAKKMVKLVELLEDLDDVQAVYSNADISQEMLDEL
jgi:DNA-binding regulatory protein, YebC/PmpR family